MGKYFSLHYILSNVIKLHLNEIKERIKYFEMEIFTKRNVMNNSEKKIN